MKLNPANIFKFLEKNEGIPIPLRAKMTTGIPLTPDDLKADELYLSELGDRITSLPDNLQVNKWVYVSSTQLSSIPKNLRIEGYLEIKNTPLSKKYSADQIRKMIEDKGGYVKGKIIT